MDAISTFEPHQTVTVSSCGVSVSYLSIFPLLGKFSNSDYSRYFPQYSCRPGVADAPYSVIYVPGDEHSVSYTEDLAVLNFPWDIMREGETILYAGYPFIEAQRQQRESLTCHAAACSINGRGVLLLGKEGAGKSSILLRLCQDYGAKLIGNDLCVIGTRGRKIVLFGGTEFFHFRRTSALRSATELVPYFPGDQDGWLEKKFFSCDEVGVDVAEGTVEMFKCYMVHTDESQDRIHMQNADGLATRLYLNENFSRYIRSTTTTILGGNTYQYLGYLPSFDTPALFSWRRQLLAELIENQGVEYISGTSAAIANCIAACARE